jgi:NADPH2:quinone reductase
MDLTGGRGVDMVLEMLANVNLDKDLGVLAQRGRVVIVGNRGTVTIDPRQTMGKDSSIIGMSLNNVTPEESKEIHAALAAGFEDGSLVPVVSQQFALADAPKSHEAVMSPGAAGKIVLVP